MQDDKNQDNHLFEDRKRADIFDTSKEKIMQEQKEPQSQKKDLDYQPSDIQITEEDQAEMSENEQKKAIEDQFKVLYDGDAELRKVLEKSDVSTFTLEEKYQIIEAYMQGGGA